MGEMGVAALSGAGGIFENMRNNIGGWLKGSGVFPLKIDLKFGSSLCEILLRTNRVAIIFKLTSFLIIAVILNTF